MRFRLIDQITAIEPRVRIEAIKHLRADEAYLQDHFPRFPVMPGVLMLEALFQTGMWLILKSSDFAEPVVRLKEARNVKFMDFVKPGQELRLECEIQKEEGLITTISGQGTVSGGGVTLSGRLIFERFQAAIRYPDRGSLDAYTRKQQQLEFERLFRSAENAR